MLCKNLQMVRKKLQLSQEDISTQFGISYRAYASYERGDRKPPLELLEKLAKLFNVNLNWLIADVGEMFIPPKFEQAQKELALEVRKILREEGLIK